MCQEAGALEKSSWRRTRKAQQQILGVSKYVVVYLIWLLGLLLGVLLSALLSFPLGTKSQVPLIFADQQCI
jgi:hypothetical protein